MTALTPLYKPDKLETPNGAASTKVANARTAIEGQRKTISDEYEAARSKVLERIKHELEQLQCTAQRGKKNLKSPIFKVNLYSKSTGALNFQNFSLDIEALAKQGGPPGRMRRKTRARGEAGGFLAEREKAQILKSPRGGVLYSRFTGVYVAHLLVY